MKNTATLPDMFWKMSPTFHVRLTHPSLRTQSTQIMVNDIDRYIIAQEGGSDGVSLHQHICVSHPDITRSSLRELVKKHYPDIRGNKALSIVKARNPEQLSRYCVKDGDFVSKGFTDSQLNRFKLLSFDIKKTKTEFTKLIEQYKLEKINLTEYARQYVKLKISANQPIYTNHFRAHLRMLKFQQDENDLNEYIGRLIEDLDAR